MRIAFLDFDGVINSHRFAQEEPLKKGFLGLDAKAVARVNRICTEGNAVVVVSSSWRYGRTLDELKELLTAVGLTAEVIDTTPQPQDLVNRQLAALFMKEGLSVGFTADHQRVLLSSSGRGREIEGWLVSRHDIESFVILDDASDMEPFHFRHVKTSMTDGLLDEHIPHALAVLATPWQRSDRDP